MTKVSILPVTAEKGEVFYHAVTRDKKSQGKTAGEALDALTAQLSYDEASTLVILQSLRPDPLFNPAQQQRLAKLMDRWRTTRDKGGALPDDEQSELDSLVEAELHAAADRAAELADELKH